jgi:predicted acyl esterase
LASAIAAVASMLVIAAVAVGAAAPAALAAPAPFGHVCTLQNGVRFCPTSSLAERIPTWDGIPLDVDVTLPPTGDGPFPLIVMLHGFGANKTEFEAGSPTGARSPDGTLQTRTYHYNNVFFAQRGYAVVNHSHRGFGNSCGLPASRTPGACDRGWWHMADQRYEVRDVQTLIGRLVDGGIAKADAIGVTGESWGGGQSTQLAWLRNRTRLTNGRLIPWRSPRGRRLSVTASWPRWLWSNVAWSLMPTGYFLDTATSAAPEDAAPVGVSLKADTTGLLLLGQTAGFIPPQGRDPTADPIGWSRLFFAGEPYGARVRSIIAGLSRFSSVTQLSGVPAPLLLQTGFTDDLFPPREALRAYNLVRARNRNAQVALQIGDLGHARGSNKLNTYVTFNDQGAVFLDHWLRGRGTAPAPGSVTAMTQTCPSPTASPPPTSFPPAGGPFRAASWTALHPGAVRVSGAATRTVRSADSDVTLGPMFTANFGTDDACLTAPQTTSPGAAYYARAVTRPFTLLGLPTVRATIAASGPYPQLATRLWDVAPDGQQRLISRGVRRLTPNQRGTITFQLNGGGYRFAAGHEVRLEVMGSDYRTVLPTQEPTFRAGNGTFTVAISRLTLELPVRERPTGDGAIGRPVPRGR